MDEKEVPSSSLLISEDKPHCLYPLYFGVSCAFFALKLLVGSDLNDGRWLATRDRMLQGSAHLLGLLVWRIQKGEATQSGSESEMLQRIEKAEIEVAELKKRRSEDAKANEKVVSIFAAQEQSWLSERKKLRQQIGALLHELQVQETKKEEIISNFNEKMQENEFLLQSKLEEEEGKRKELEEKVQKAEAAAEELRDIRKKEAEEHSSELWKHKTAFIELVSNHRHLESEMGRALRQVDAAKQELDSVLRQKEESVLMAQKLSLEVVKVRKDSEQKDKILSAMLRKSKLDTMEKEVLLRELKISKARRKEAEIEMEKWRAIHESRHEKHSTISNLANQGNARSEAFSGLHPNEAGSSQNRRMISQPQGNWMNSKNLVREYLEVDQKQKLDHIAPKKTVNETSNSFDDCSPLGNGELVITTDVKQLEDWVHSETERNTAVLQQRHRLEIDAFSEQLRLKDEKLEAFRWRLLSLELEVKRSESHIKGLNQNLLQLTEEKMNLKTLLSDQETKLKSLQEKFINLQLNPPHSHQANWNSSPKDLTVDPLADSSNAKNMKKKAKERDYPLQDKETLKEEQDTSSNQSMDGSMEVRIPEEDVEVEKEVSMDMGHVEEQCMNVEAKRVAMPTPEIHSLTKRDTPWKVDLHALGVSYNIKRLRQQLLLLEKLVGMPETCEERADDTGNTQTSFHLLMPLLNRQVIRYQSLQERIDDLCGRMHKQDVDGNGGVPRTARTKEETRTLESLLEETFQLQRYMVATGQKLMEIQSRMESGSVGGVDKAEKPGNFDMRRFSDNARTLFKEVQRGLEVRIARVIGNLEGTLASGRSFDSGMKSS